MRFDDTNPAKENAEFEEVCTLVLEIFILTSFDNLIECKSSCLMPA